MNAIKEHIDFQASALSLRERRNNMLASNIANAGTPGYKARDLDFSSEMARHCHQGQQDYQCDVSWS